MYITDSAVFGEFIVVIDKTAQMNTLPLKIFQFSMTKNIIPSPTKEKQTQIISSPHLQMRSSHKCYTKARRTIGKKQETCVFVMYAKVHSFESVNT